MTKGNINKYETWWRGTTEYVRRARESLEATLGRVIREELRHASWQEISSTEEG